MAGDFRAAQISDNLILMRDVSATDASRNFSDLLDAVEHGGESFVIRRHGRAVARLEPAGANGAEVRAVLRSRPTDAAWARELSDLRTQLHAEERPWSD